jgi:hypothetical protein
VNRARPAEQFIAVLGSKEYPEPQVRDAAIASLRDEAGRFKPEAVAELVSAMPEIVGRTSTYFTGSILASEVELTDALIAQAGAETTSDWDRLTVGLVVKKASEAVVKANPEDPDPVWDTVYSDEEIKASVARSDVLAAKADELIGDELPNPERVLSRCSSLIAQGVSPHEAETYMRFLPDYPEENEVLSAEVARGLTEYLDKIPRDVKALLENESYNGNLDPARLLAGRAYIDELAAEIPEAETEARNQQLIRMISILQIDRRASPEQATQAITVLEELRQHGANLNGAVGLIQSGDRIAEFAAAAQQNPEQYQQSLELMATWSQHPELNEPSAEGERTSGLRNADIVKNLLTYGGDYKPSFEVISRRFDEALTSGYPESKIIDDTRFIFSNYIINNSSTPEGADLRASFLESHYTAFTTLGGSTIELNRLLGSLSDHIPGELAGDIERGATTDVQMLRGQLDGLVEQLNSLQQTNPELFDIIAATDAAKRVSLHSLDTLGGYAEAATRSSDDLVEQLIVDYRTSSTVIGDLEQIPGLTSRTANLMIDNGYGRNVIARPELFAGFQLDASVATHIVEKFGPGLVLRNAEAFSDLDMTALAKQSVQAGFGLDILDSLSRFPEITEMVSDGDPTIERFMGLINDEKITLLLGENGPLHQLASQYFQLYMSAENPQLVLTSIRALADGDHALWQINYEYARLLVGEVGNRGYLANYQVDQVPLALPRADISQLSDELPPPTKLVAMDADTLKLILSADYLAAHPDITHLEAATFNDLNPDAQESLLAYRLYESIAESRSPSVQQLASERNRAFSERGNYWQEGDLVHATNEIAGFRRILLSGVLCGETLGAGSAADSYPYNVDTVAVSPEVLAGSSHGERLTALKNQGYGDIALLFHRTPESTDYGRETQGGMNADHRLVFAALPATEVSAVLLRGGGDELASAVIDSVVESGMFVPVVDATGQIILSYDEFERRREDGNYVGVTPRIVDSSFKREGTQGGSNDGAMFILPSPAGTEQYYVKFGDASALKRDHLWTEMLADSLYRSVTPDLIPETEAIVVEGRLARSSKLVDIAPAATVTESGRNAGFIMDAYLGNWDAVYNAANLVMTTDGRAMRIDTGNGLDFRARGEHKAPGQFGDVVTEVEQGANIDELGQGMRRMYPGLTDAEISEQVVALRDNLPEAKIDELVNAIRRPQSERAELARTLKARRQYLIDKFL